MECQPLQGSRECAGGRAYARASSAAGGFDHGNSHLTRTQLTLDPRDWSDLSRACLRLLDQVDRIAEASKERIERNPHTGDTKDIALVMMLFEAARLAVDAEGDPVVERRRRHRRPVAASAAATCGLADVPRLNNA